MKEKIHVAFDPANAVDEAALTLRIGSVVHVVPDPFATALIDHMNFTADSQYLAGTLNGLRAPTMEKYYRRWNCVLCMVIGVLCIVLALKM